MTKRCPKCRLTLAIELFPRNKNKPGGRHSCCSQCHKDYVSKHREHLLKWQRKYNKKYRKENKEKIRKWERSLEGRFVRLSGTKRFAYPTKEEAIASFIARKQRHLSILTAQLKDVTRILNIPSSEYKDATDFEL